MGRVRLGLIGLGMIGRVHAETAAKLPQCELVAVSDVNSNTEIIANALQISYFRDYIEMIDTENLEGVIIAVPNNLHADVGVACAQRHLHMLLEKPIASTLADADRLIAAARTHDVQLLIGHHRRFNAAINAARDMIYSGKIGSLIGVSILWSMYKPQEYFELAWRKLKGGGPILINTIHEIAIFWAPRLL